MTMQTVGQYQIDIYHDEVFEQTSADNVHWYDFAYFDESEYGSTTVFGIKIFKNNHLLKSAVIGSAGGATTNHDTALVVEVDRLVICCSDSVFCLTIPDLTLLWRTQADDITCFEIFKYQDSYIVHGELAITRLDKDGNILWQEGGADIFTTISGKDRFYLTDDFIIAVDWENRIYRFDYNGKSYTDMSQFSRLQ